MSGVASTSGGRGFGIETDDQGEQRLFGLPPGEYYVSATASLGLGPGPASNDREGRTRFYAPTFYPGTASFADAQRVSVAVGQEARVGFSLVALRPARISGTIRSAAGTPYPRPSVMLTPFEMNLPGATVQSQPDGRFVAPRVFPGDYVLSVTPPFNDPNAPAEYVRLRMNVTGDDIDGLVVTTHRGTTVRGRIVTDPPDGSAAVRMDALLPSVNFPDRNGTSGRSVVGADGTFEISAVNGAAGEFRMNLAQAPGWFLKAVMVGGKDVTDTPMDFADGRDLDNVQMVITRSAATITGSAVDARNAATSDYVAVVFPEDRALWNSSRRLAAGRPDQRGQFRIIGLPPGPYLIAATEYLEPGAERDPDTLAQLAGNAQKVTLDTGTPVTVTLKLAP
jgi:hypothetical protein